MYARDGSDMHPKKIDIFGVHIFLSRKQKNCSPEFEIGNEMVYLSPVLDMFNYVPKKESVWITA